MKELTIEEKAQRYDEAIERAKRAHNSAKLDKENGVTDKITEYTIQLIETIFSELKENEDVCDYSTYFITYFKNAYGENSNARFAGIKVKDIIAWLEKQGKHANFLNKIQVGDKVTRNQEGVLVNLSQLKRVAKKDEKQGERRPANKVASNLLTHERAMEISPFMRSGFENKDKVEPKFHEGDIIKPKDGGHEPWQIIQVDISDKKYRFKDGYVIHFSQEDAYELVEQKPVENSAKVSESSTEEKDMGEYKKGFECGKQRVLKYPEDFGLCKKSAWSEKDEINLEKAIWYVENPAPMVVKDSMLVEWLKSLKDRYAWKPSDEQMAALLVAVGDEKKLGNDVGKELYELYLKLKQL